MEVFFEVVLHQQMSDETFGQIFVFDDRLWRLPAGKLQVGGAATSKCLDELEGSHLQVRVLGFNEDVSGGLADVGDLHFRFRILIWRAVVAHLKISSKTFTLQYRKYTLISKNFYFEYT